jgi:PPK2 family polyphosphate:nucleotide phosphotransferase
MAIESFPNPNQFLYNGDLDSFPTRVAKPDNVGEILEDQVKRIGERQEVLYADGRYALLLVFQGMDCAGKDSTIKNVLSGVNPQGVHVASFRAPTHHEEDYSYLWRCWRELPRRGMIGVFNRSHYEEVLVMRVHPEYFESRKMPHPELNDAFWSMRMHDLHQMEDHLTRNAIHVVKFYLNLSKDEQKERLLARINRPHKIWKFNPDDIDEREHWSKYRQAFAAAIHETHTETCPWYVIPADNKPTMRALVAQIVADKLASMPIDFPTPSAALMATLDASKARLLAE